MCSLMALLMEVFQFPCGNQIGLLKPRDFAVDTKIDTATNVKESCDFYSRVSNAGNS